MLHYLPTRKCTDSDVCIYDIEFSAKDLIPLLSCYAD